MWKERLGDATASGSETHARTEAMERAEEQQLISSELSLRVLGDVDVATLVIRQCENYLTSPFSPK